VSYPIALAIDREAPDVNALAFTEHGNISVRARWRESGTGVARR
jgi:hypothetical protein